MSVSTAMYAAVTGLDTMGRAMAVISNNIANLNTVGFKASRANFQDLLSQSAHTGAGRAQIGRGVQLGSVTQLFSQGSFKNSAQNTDIAIAGEGFFQVRNPISGEFSYSRAGNFIFDRNGQLTTPAGFILQGWRLDEEGNRVGTPTDVTMFQNNAPPQATTRATYVANLDSTADSKTDGAPLSTVWRGDLATMPINGNAYNYQTSVRIYDSLGNGHDLSIFFDPDDQADNKWDYIVCADPEDDVRTLTNGTVFDGILQRGTITFEPTDPVTGNGGAIRNITADNLIGSNPDNITLPNLAGWPATIDVERRGTYSGNANKTYTFTIMPGDAGTIGTPPGPNLTWNDGAGNTGVINDVAFDTWYTTAEGVQFQIPSATSTTTALAAGDSFSLACTANWSAMNTNANGYFNFDAAFVTDPDTGLPVSQNIEINFGARNPTYPGGSWNSDNMATTQYAATSTTLFQTQDGFASGYLQSIAIDADGVLTGSYSNGRIESVFQIGLALFPSQWGLEKIGNNLYNQTRLSGVATINPAGTGGTGTISPNSLEQSNVDLSDEFVEMIVQQRGFQANSKVITTTDTLMSEVINLKR
jgi:flagellar hook protein FlgE